jgi:hypothetical protein
MRVSTNPIDRAFDRAIELTKELRENYGDDELYNNPSMLSGYYADLIELTDEGMLTREEAAFLISDTVWFKAVSYYQNIEKVVKLADYFVLALARSDNREQQRWGRLVQSIEQAKKFYSRS